MGGGEVGCTRGEGLGNCTDGEGWGEGGEGGGGSCVTLTAFFLGLDAGSGSGCGGMGINNSNPCNPMESNHIGRISLCTGAGKFFKKRGLIIVSKALNVRQVRQLG